MLTAALALSTIVLVVVVVEAAEYLASTPGGAVKALSLPQRRSEG